MKLFKKKSSISCVCAHMCVHISIYVLTFVHTQPDSLTWLRICVGSIMGKRSYQALVGSNPSLFPFRLHLDLFTN